VARTHDPEFRHWVANFTRLHALIYVLRVVVSTKCSV
jgi:hypothetical protein